MLFKFESYHCHDWYNRSIHCHRDGHFVERNSAEKNLHVFDRVDGDTCGKGKFQLKDSVNFLKLLSSLV